MEFSIRLGQIEADYDDLKVFSHQTKTKFLIFDDVTNRSGLEIRLIFFIDFDSDMANRLLSGNNIILKVSICQISLFHRLFFHILFRIDRVCHHS